MKKKKSSRADLIFNIINYTVFGIFTLLCVYPFYYLIINTISANDLSANGSIIFWPKGMHFENYIEVLKLKGLMPAALISLGRTVLGTACTVLASSFLGFAFTQQYLWKRKVWYRILVASMYFNAGLIPMYLTMNTLHLTNNFFVYIIPVIVQPFNIILVKTYVESLPISLQEAAEIDGAGHLSIMFKVMWHQCKGMALVTGVNTAILKWNAWFEASIYIPNNKELWPLQLWVKSITASATEFLKATRPNYDKNLLQYTVIVAATAPILLAFPFFIKKLEKGMALGGVKG